MGENKVAVYNPLETDFEVSYDTDGTDYPYSYKVPALDIAFFEPLVADHVAKHLATAVMDKRSVKTNYPDEHEKVLREEILITI